MLLIVNRWRLGIIGAVATLALAANVATASASVTIGQLAPPTVSVSCVGSTLDQLQQTVNTGASYVVPSIPPATSLVISSWSHQAVADPSVPFLTMKVFRKFADPATYMVVGHDGPRTLTPGITNAFRTYLPVQPGDVLGLNSAIPAATACNFESVGNMGTNFIGPNLSNLADGESALFTGGSSDRILNIHVVVSPTNEFTVDRIKRKKSRGTANAIVTVPNPGQIDVGGTGSKLIGAPAGKDVAAAGAVGLKIGAIGKKAAKLRRKGKVKLKVAITYVPTGGEPSQQTLSLKLRLV
jgi:hypothetical protein